MDRKGPRQISNCPKVRVHSITSPPIFRAFVLSPQRKCVLVQEERQTVVSVLNAYFSTGRLLLAEARHLYALLSPLRVGLDIRWLLSVVNGFSNYFLSSTWSANDFHV